MPASSTSWEQEFALWQAAALGNSIDEYQGYLTAYPDGKFAAIAKARIVKLVGGEDAIEPAAAASADAVVVNAPQVVASGLSVGTPESEALLLSERATRREVQGRLTALGFATGGADGVLGGRSRTAISQWQTAAGAPVTAYLSYDQLAKLRTDSEASYQRWLAAQVQKPAPRRSVASGRVPEGRVRDSSADAAIALGVLGLAAGVIGGVAASRHHHRGPGPVFRPGPGGRPGFGPRR